MQTTKDMVRLGSYVNETFYRSLVEDFAGCQLEGSPCADLAERDCFRMLLEREARLLDERNFDAWLALYALECVYWVPARVPAGDPRKEVCIAFDDRLRLEDRIYRLRTGYAWSQLPASRTTRLIANVEVFRTSDDACRMVRSHFLTVEFRSGDTRIWAGWYRHRLRLFDAGWRIEAKQVNLVDYDQNLRNPSIIF